MFGTRRLATIEEQIHNDNPQLRQLQTYIREAQSNLLKSMFTFSSGTPIRNLIETFDKLITKKFFSEFNETFNSIESIKQAFDKLLIDFDRECLAQGVAETHQPLCKGLQLTIKWYRIKAIEAFLHQPLAFELAINKEDKSEIQATLPERFASLTKQIHYFNTSLQEFEQRVSICKIPVVDMKATTLKEVLAPLMRQEFKQGSRLDESMIFDRFTRERAALESNLKTLNQELEQDITSYRSVCAFQKSEREKLYDSKLDIDVYYVSEFKEKYSAAFAGYKKAFDNRKINEFSKVEAIEKLIHHVSEPVREFELLLAEYYNNTLYLSITSYRYAINSMYEWLNKQFATFKSNSSVLKVESEYREEYHYVREGLPQSKKLVEDAFSSLAKEFLREVATRNWRSVNKMREEANRGFEAEIERHISKIKPRDKVPVIMPIKILDLQREMLNQNWREAFSEVFARELQQISAQFKKAKTGESASDLLVFKKIESRLQDKRNEIDAILYSDRDRYFRASNVLSEVYLKANKDLVMLDLRGNIERLEKAALPPKKELKPPLTSPAIKRSVTKATAEVSDTSPWYAKFTDKSWKRALCYALLTFVLVAGVLTVWGAVAGIAMGFVAMGALGVGGSTAVLVGGGYYIGQRCCCVSTTESMGEHEQSPSVNLFAQNALDKNADREQKYPSNPAYRTFASSGIVPSKSEQKTSSVSGGAHGIFGSVAQDQARTSLLKVSETPSLSLKRR